MGKKIGVTLSLVFLGLSGSVQAREPGPDDMWAAPHLSIPGGTVITMRPVPVAVSDAIPTCRNGNGRLARDWVHDTTKTLDGCWRMEGKDVRIDWPGETKLYPASAFTQVNP